LRWASVSGLPATLHHQATPRSMRPTAGRPQCFAMSVAFDDQGEIVPSRGVTSSSVPCWTTAAVAGP